MRVLYLGLRGDDVRQWQNFLLGQGYDLIVNGRFDSDTQELTESFQDSADCQPIDGVVGTTTLGAAMARGFSLDGLLDRPKTDSKDQSTPLWPPPPKDLFPLSMVDRQRKFGRIEYISDPTDLCLEAVRVMNGWVAKNIVTVSVPQLLVLAQAHPKGGFPKKGLVEVHRLVADPLVALFEAWEEADLLDRILSYGGLLALRFIRGSDTILSNHAFGSAVDINVAWNPLGCRPALVGQEGSVRDLVPIANSLGWYWGGHYTTRQDGMHFEYVGKNDS